MNRVVISDVVEIISGGTPKTSVPEFWNGSIGWVSIKDFNKDLKYIETTEKTITSLGLEKSSTKLLQPNDVIISARGTVGALAMVKKPLTFNQSCFALRSNGLINPDFLYYALKDTVASFKKYSHGSVFDTINLSTFNDITIPFPPLHEQQKIASVLSALDNQIELNNQINQALEDFAQILYNYWFVQFEFPNEEGKPYKSSGGKMVWNEELNREIPVGWEVKKLSSLSKVLTGKKDANFANKNGKYKFFTCSQEVYKCDDFDFDGDAILIAGNGDFNVKTYSGKFNAYQRTYVVLPNNKIDYSLIALSVEKNILSFKANAQGSIVKFIKKGDVEEIRIIIPNSNRILDKLNQIRKTVQQNKEQIEELSQLRDYLLPLLMNGQVTVSDELF